MQVSLSGLRAFAAPPRRAVAQLFVDDAWFSGGRLCLKRATMNRYELAVTIPEPSAVLAAALRDDGRDVRTVGQGQVRPGAARTGHPAWRNWSASPGRWR